VKGRVVQRRALMPQHAILRHAALADMQRVRAAPLLLRHAILR
jgi:hypothetical protein